MTSTSRPVSTKPAPRSRRIGALAIVAPLGLAACGLKAANSYDKLADYADQFKKLWLVG